MTAISTTAQRRIHSIERRTRVIEARWLKAGLVDDDTRRESITLREAIVGRIVAALECDYLMGAYLRARSGLKRHDLANVLWVKVVAHVDWHSRLRDQYM